MKWSSLALRIITHMFTCKDNILVTVDSISHWLNNVQYEAFFKRLLELDDLK